MKTKNILLAVLFIFICSISSTIQAYNKRDLPQFDKIIVAQGIRVVYTQSDKQSVIVSSMNKNGLDDVITNVKGETLEISLRTGHALKKSDLVTVIVENPCLKEVYTLGESSFKSKKIEGNCPFKVTLSSKSKVSIDELNLSADIELIIAGRSEFTSNKLISENLSLTMRNNSHGKIKDAHVNNEICIKSEGNSYAVIGGETRQIQIESDSPNCLDTRNLAYSKIDILEN